MSLNVDDELVHIPTLTIQPSFTTVIQEVWSGIIPSEEIWLSRYHRGTDSVHDRIRVTLDEEDRDKVIWTMPTASRHAGLKLTRNDDGTYSVDSTRLLVPIQTYSVEEGRPHRITSLAVAPDGSQFAIGLLDGTIYLYPVVQPVSPEKRPKYDIPQDPAVLDRRQSMVESPGNRKAHKSTVTSLQFFPSSRVLLSGGADFTIRIWPAEPAPSSPQPPPSPEPARTLTAHTRSITSLTINPLDRGRTVLSASADGSIRHWNVSGGNEVTESRIRPGGSGVVDTSLDSDAKRLYCALQDGSFEVFSVELPSNEPSRATPVEQKLPERIFKASRSVGGALTSVAVSFSPGPKLLATGSASGIVSVYDAEGDFPLLVSFKRNGAGIEALTFLSSPLDASQSSLGLAIATFDGLPWIASIVPNLDKRSATVKPYAELTGGEIDAVRDVVVVENQVWTVCDDGVARRYRLS